MFDGFSIEIFLLLLTTYPLHLTAYILQLTSDLLPDSDTCSISTSPDFWIEA